MWAFVKPSSCAVGALLFGAGPALAHAADQGFVLLLPTTAYITGGTLTVVLTILLLVFLRPGQLAPVFRPVTLPLGCRVEAARRWTQAAAALCLALLILVGLRGPTDPQANLMPLVLWTVWWMLFFVVQAVVFDIWAWVNPFPALHRFLASGRGPRFPLPARLSIWPAVLLMAAFQGFVLADVAPNDPSRLARFAMGYWVFTLAGMTLCGRKAWLAQVECFSVLFALIGAIRMGRGRQIGVPGWQVVEEARFDMSHAAFVLMILAAGSFDGLYETFWWLGAIGVNPLEFPGRSALIWPTVLGLFGGIVTLAGVFAAVIFLGVRLVRSPVAYGAAFVGFAITLLPIAIGYHFAHYLVTFLVQIQVTLAALGDPLAQGWNLMGLGDRRVMVGFLTVPGVVRVIWLAQAGIVVLSHVLAVILSHRTAERLSDARRDVLLLELGLSLLMIFYTIFGLWLLASPRGA